MLRVPTIYVLSKIKKYLTFFHMKITIFTAVKYCSILHGHVCVMRSIFDPTNEVFMQQKFLQGIYYISNLLLFNMPQIATFIAHKNKLLK